MSSHGETYISEGYPISWKRVIGPCQAYRYRLRHREVRAHPREATITVSTKYVLLDGESATTGRDWRPAFADLKTLESRNDYPDTEN